MKKILLSLKKTLIFACLAVSCFILQAMAGINLPTRVQKIALSNDGLLYILGKQQTAIRIYSADGSLQRSLEIDPTHGLNLQGSEPIDFFVDARGDIYCLIFRPDIADRRSGLVRIDKAGEESTVISLNKPLYAFQMNKDSAGNFYLLGFETNINKSIALEKELPPTVYLVHKFSPDGQYLGSLLPVKGTSVDKLLVNAMYLSSSFAVLPNGEVWFFEQRVDSQLPPWQNVWSVHRVDKEGFAARVDPVSLPDHFIVGIHEYAGDVAFEWANFKEISSLRLLTRIDGTSIGTVEGGSIKAIKNDNAVTSRIAEGGIYQLTLAPVN